MYSVRKYFKAILLCYWTNPEFKLMIILFLNHMQIVDHNTDPISSVIKSHRNL